MEIDGCFVDSHELGKSYGTAMGLLCLARLGKVEYQPIGDNLRVRGRVVR